MLSSYHPSFSGFIGVARADITPPTAIYSRNWGAAQHDVADGVHRPFTATALTIQNTPQAEPLVLCALDLGWWRTPEDEWALRGALLKELGLDASRVMMNLSHTHAGPSLCRDDAAKPGGRHIAPYLDALRDDLIRITRQALASACRATLEWNSGWCNLAANRDLPDPEAARFLCGFNPQAPGDGTLLVGRVTDENGQSLATVVNYACHPTTLAWQCRFLSPDYPATMRKVVETMTGAPCLFLQGASGELAPRRQYTGDIEIAEAHGRELGFAVFSLVQGMLPPQTQLSFQGVQESGASLALWGIERRAQSSQVAAQLVNVELPLKEMPSTPQIEADLESCDDRVVGERLRRKLHIRRAVGDGATTGTPLWVWRAGDVIFVGQPNEAYSLLQRELRAAFPDCAVVVMNLVNGSMGYLPPAGLYNENLYPVWQTPFAAGSLEAVIEAARDAVSRQLESHHE